MARRSSSNRSYNLISFIFFVLTLITCFGTVAILNETVTIPDVLAPPTDIALQSTLVRQTWTPSFTPPPTDIPAATDTPTPTLTRTATATQTATLTITPLPTDTPTQTPTVTPSSTYTLTFTPSNTPTITLTPSATGFTATPTRTPVAFPFIIESVEIRPALENNCNFQGFGGNVFNLINEPIDGLRVMATGPGLPEAGVIGITGAATNFGPGGWEVRVSEVLNNNQYTVQLQNTDGTVLSQPINQTFASSCDSNLLLIRFKQIRPY